MSIFTGSATAMVTPFHDKGIDYDSFEKQIEFQINNGTSALLVCGTTGEPSTMTATEKLDCISFVIDRVRKRVPVIAGTGGNCTSEVIELSKKAEMLGANALLVVTPYYNKTTQKGLVEHYYAVANSVETPIIVYNVPSRTGLNIRPETLVKLSMHRNICANKEAAGDICQVSDMVRLCGKDFDIYSGEDKLNLPILAMGGVGVVSVISNIAPREVSNLVKFYFEGSLRSARELQFKLNPLIDALFLETNPIPVKTAMNLLGMNAGKLRLPLVEPGDDNKNILIEELKNFGFNI